MLSLKADEVATSYSVKDFHASWCWQKHFKRRHNLSLRSRTRQGQQTPEHLAKVRQDFAAEVSATMDELGVSTVYNADQTVFAKENINLKGPKTVWVRCSGKSKERATVMLLGDNHGRKYTPFAVLKAAASAAKDIQLELDNKHLRRGFGVYVWKTIQKLHETEDLEIYGNPKGWWNHDLSVISFVIILLSVKT
ncbi:hypothetical protein DVH05_026333 [Phytophthora capsici]|nr:hypothetical protein DVH05_026333 [Phytophthora capsici]